MNKTTTIQFPRHKMKNSIIILAFALILINFSTNYAQFNVGLNGGLQVPTSEQFKFMNNTGYGISLSGEYKIPAIPLAVLLCVDYDNWQFKDIVGFSGKSIVRFKGYRMYSFVVSIGPMLYLEIPGSPLSTYAGINLGAMASSSTFSISTNISGFLYSPFVGMRYPILPRILSLDINVKKSFFKENNVNEILSWLGMNAGLVLTL